MGAGPSAAASPGLLAGVGLDLVTIWDAVTQCWCLESVLREMVVFREHLQIHAVSKVIASHLIRSVVDATVALYCISSESSASDFLSP